jgi:hypothetical protein
MNKLQKSRWRNILRKAAKANRLHKKGYMVFDHYSDGKLYQGSENARVIWADKEQRWGNVLDITIEEYNAKFFDKWQIVHPKHIKKLS